MNISMGTMRTVCALLEHDLREITKSKVFVGWLDPDAKLVEVTEHQATQDPTKQNERRSARSQSPSKATDQSPSGHRWHFT